MPSGGPRGRRVTKISITNLKAGQRRVAAEGKLPAGVGNGMLSYNLANIVFLK